MFGCCPPASEISYLYCCVQYIDKNEVINLKLRICNIIIFMRYRNIFTNFRTLERDLHPRTVTIAMKR